MNPLQPHLATPSYRTWNLFEMARFVAAVDLRWITSPASQVESFNVVIDLLKRQEEEILCFPQGQAILQRFPANPDNPLFYFQRERWLEAYNKVQFWRQLPGGGDYLRHQVIDGYEQAWANQLGVWMLSRPEVLTMKTLHIRQGVMTRIPPEISLCREMGCFMMMNNCLQELPPQFGELVNLQMVFLCNNRLRRLCPEFQHLQQLERLEITNNRLENIDLVGLLRNLDCLNVKKNQIRRLPLQIQWERLRILDIGDNQLTELSDNLYDVTSLEVLMLSHNRLSSISERIVRFSNLDSLFLDYNQLTTLPASLCKLPKLRSIFIPHNRVAEIPQNLVEAPALIEIIFTGNPLSQRPAFLPPRIWTDVH